MLFVGRLESRKGADVLLACIPQLCCEQFPELRFRLVGEDVREQPGQATPLELFRVQHDALVRSGRVVLTGRVSDEELLQSYASCDIFVAPSRFESFGLIVLEAMMFGKPVVSAMWEGSPRSARMEWKEFWLRLEDSAALAAGLARLAANSELRQKMGAAARKRYLAGFTLEHMISGLVKVYDELLLTKQRGVRC